MLAQHALGNLNQPVHTARSLHNTCTSYGSNDDVDNVGRWCTRFQTESKNE